MNYWTGLSVEYANQRSYLDDLFRVYPTIPEGIRDINEELWGQIETAFNRQDNLSLLQALLKLDLFPVKDSYIAYLKRSPDAIKRNPQTVNRICGRLYDMGLAEMFQRCSEPKETNRQIGPMFRRWLASGALGLTPQPVADFASGIHDAILGGGDQELQRFAVEHLGYTHDKGLDFIGRFNNRYVIGEAKFLTDFGGHQNAQFNDAIAMLNAPSKAQHIAVLDGVVYIQGRNKMFQALERLDATKPVLSSLVLREYLYQL